MANYHLWHKFNVTQRKEKLKMYVHNSREYTDVILNTILHGKESLCFVLTS